VSKLSQFAYKVVYMQICVDIA